MSADRIALALEGRCKRHAGRLYGEVVTYLADNPTTREEREALGLLLAMLDRRRAITPERRP